ncbi:MAG: OmpA family protein [Archangiaceae bacterium]|nr:OmpA family protein [Archangiaceae bacterium]
MKSARGPWVLLVLVLLGFGALGYYGWQLLQKAHADQDSAVKARDEAVARADAAQQAKGELQKKLDEAAAARDEALAKQRSLEQNLEQTSAELAKLKATTDSLQEKLKAEIQKGDIKLSQSGDRIQVDLVDKVLFDSGDAALSKRGEEVLGKVAAVLKTVEEKQIQVSGHTDDSPITNPEIKKLFATNWELSVARAVNVVRYLTETGGVPPKNVLAAGYSQYHPVGGNATPKGRAANRRIEILLTPVQQVLAQGKKK